MRGSIILAVAVAVATTGCYKATVDTGLRPSGQTVQQDWAHAFIGGLVPPATVETASRCPNGVATVQTQMSFLNMLASGLTWGLYTPMTITVQCAAQGGSENEASLTISSDASITAATAVFNSALNQSQLSGEPVLIRFE